ncbi:MAG: hypothetical protein ABEH35_06345 [Haloarculaceae archaeon]
MDRDRLERELRATFGASDESARVVARQARDLADGGTYADDIGHDLTVEEIVQNLADAPDGHTLAERWNWWLGALELSHGGYERFRVRPDVV